MIDVACYQLLEYKGYQYVVFYMETGYMGHFNAYVKLPENHPEYKKGIKQKWFSLGASVKNLKTMAEKSEIPFLKDLPEPPVETYKRHYHRDYDAIPLDVHGGLTFGNLVTKNNKEDFLQPFTPGLWLGWDYAHYQDEIYLPKERMIEKDEKMQDAYASIMAIHNEYDHSDEKRWTWEEVEIDCKDAIDQLITLEKGSK